MFHLTTMFQLQNVTRGERKEFVLFWNKLQTVPRAPSSDRKEKGGRRSREGSPPSPTGRPPLYQHPTIGRPLSARTPHEPREGFYTPRIKTLSVPLQPAVPMDPVTPTIVKRSHSLRDRFLYYSRKIPRAGRPASARQENAFVRSLGKKPIGKTPQSPAPILPAADQAQECLEVHLGCDADTVARLMTCALWKDENSDSAAQERLQRLTKCTM